MIFSTLGRRILGGAGAFTFDDLYNLFLFLTALWIVGKGCEKFGMPSVVGEIITGLVLGPELLKIAPEYHTNSLMLLGECGLILLVIEAGLEVDIKLLKVIGSRGVAVALAGSLVPVSMGFGIALACGAETKAAFAIGCCLAPTSMGIAVNVLKKGGVLNTQIGQLVIASAVLDDIISLVLLGVVSALEDPTPLKLITPLLVSFGFLLGVGFFAFYVMPVVLPMLVKQVPEDLRDHFLLFCVFSLSLALIPAAHHAGSSHLLGSFLAGLCFCHNHHVHEVWGRQVKRIMQWLLRLFFGGTIAFEVPIKDIWTKEIISKAFALFAAIVGKLATCVWAPGFPNRMYDAFKLGSAMSAWGEFAFILATMSHGEHIIDDEEFASVILAILMSVIIGPILLGYAIRCSNDEKKETVRTIKAEMDDLAVVPENRLRRYFKITLKSEAQWGFLYKAEDKMTELKLQILDRRIDYSGKYDHDVTLTIIAMDDSVDLNGDGKVEDSELEARRMQISKAAFEVCANANAKVSVSRWIPRRVTSINRQATLAKIETEDITPDDVIFLHSRFPRDEMILHNDSTEVLAKRFINHTPCLAVVTEDEVVLGIVTKYNLTYGLLHHKMSLGHCRITDFMTDVKDLVFMSKNSTPEQILEMMREHNCKHMPLKDDYSGDLLTIVDIRDIVMTCTDKFKKRVAGVSKTSSHAHRDFGHDKSWTSKAGTKIKSESKLDADCENHMDHPFHDGHHVVWDEHQHESTSTQEMQTTSSSKI